MTERKYSLEKKRRDLTPGALTAPIPPAIVTVGDLEHANLLTVAWTGILATVPPKTYISVRPSRHSYGILCEGREFVINLPSSDMAKTVDFVGIYTGAKVDKFTKCALTKLPSKEVAPPTVAECPIALECRVTDILKMGSHDVFIADIVSVSCKEEIIDSDGKMHFEKADLLAYAHGEYYALGERLGRFGFSTDRKKAQKAPENPKKSPKNPKKDQKNAEFSQKSPSSSSLAPEKAPKEDPRPSPFYETAPRSKTRPKKPSDKNKGAPHGRRKAGKT